MIEEGPSGKSILEAGDARGPSDPTPFEWSSLYTKAQRFTGRSIRAEESADGDAAAVWAACALELLAKAALSKLNPLLVAYADDDGTSLLAAAGVGTRASEVRSISARATFLRAAKVFPKFSQHTALRIAGSRNDELHSGLRGFAPAARESWLAQYWTQIHILLAALDKDVVDFVGPAYQPIVEGHLERNSVRVSERVGSLMERAKQRLAMTKLPDATQQSRRDLQMAVARAWELLASRALMGAYVQCPACGGEAQIAGDEVTHSDIEYNYEDATDRPTESGEAVTDALGCETCGLALDGVDLVAVARVDPSFEFEHEYEPWDEYPVEYHYDPDDGRDL